MANNIPRRTDKSVPAIPNVPANLPADIRFFLETVKQAIEIRLGHRGDPLDRNPTVRELKNAGLVEINEITAAMLLPVSYDELTDDTGLPAPENVTYAATTSNIIISWDAYWQPNFKHTEIWRAGPYTQAEVDAPGFVAPVVGAAIPIGISEGAMYADAVEQGAHYYYWVRFVSQADEYGPWHSDPNGLHAQAAYDPKVMLANLSAQISSTHLDNWLTTQINQVGTNKADIEVVEITVDDHAGYLAAGWGVKLDVDGYVSGFGLLNEGGLATAIFRTDLFAVGAPGTPDAFPFIIDAQNNAVIMDTAYIGDATITDAHISGLAVDKITGLDANFITARVDSLDVGKVTGLTGSYVAALIKYLGIEVTVLSTSFLTSGGTQGFKIDAETGNAVFNDIYARGDIEADKIKANALEIINTGNLVWGSISDVYLDGAWGYNIQYNNLPIPAKCNILIIWNWLVPDQGTGNERHKITLRKNGIIAFQAYLYSHTMQSFAYHHVENSPGETSTISLSALVEADDLNPEPNGPPVPFQQAMAFVIKR